VHADASNFAHDVTTEEAYKQVLEAAEGLFEGQRNWISNLANTASLLWHAYKSLPAPASEVNWAGSCPFQSIHFSANDNRVLRPRSNLISIKTRAHTRTLSRESCMPDYRFRTWSMRLVAIIDVDCKVKSGFDQVDRVWLEHLAVLLGGACNW
ncbi:Free methionine-R-sulfoxide reductase, partial [Hyphodiscus hymeniophilus]